MSRGRATITRRRGSARATKLNAATMTGPYYTAVPGGPVLDANSASKVSTFASVNKYANLGWSTACFAVPGDPQYSIVYDQDPAAQSGQPYSWALGNRALSAEESEPIRIPDPPNFYVQPGDYASGTSWDGWGAIVDPARSLVWSGWRMVKNGANWQATTSGSFSATDLVTKIAGGGRGDGLSTVAGAITAQEVEAAMADATDTYVIPHALAVAVPPGLSDTNFRAPATGTDGTTAPTTSTLSHGSRFVLDSAATTSSTNRLIKAITRTLKTYGLYITDRAGSDGIVVNFERFNPANPGDMVAPSTGAASSITDPTAICGSYFRAGLTWDFFNLSAVPWASLRLLQQWDGGGTPTGGPTTVTRGIAPTANDGAANFGTLLDQPSLGTGYGDTAHRAFFRFLNITVPQGKTITSATLTLTKGFADTGSLSAAIRGHNVDNSGAFTTAAAVTGAAITTAASATITSTSAAWNAAGTITVDVTAVVQAIVNRSGWASGNALSLLGVNVASTGNGYFEVLDASASLSIVYT